MVKERPAKAAAVSPLSVVILAAGEGKRMKSALPKVLQPLAGSPLLQHVIGTARALAPEAIYVVYGHGGECVREALKTEDVTWVLQRERLGTGHAVLQAMPQIPDGHTVLVLYGDVPLIRAQTLAELLALAGAKRLSLLTVKLDDPRGYGRVVRNARGLVQKIVEEKDAGARQRALHECNTGVLACAAQRLKAWLAQAQGRQRPGRVLPHRRHRDGREGEGQREPARGSTRPPRCSGSTTRRSWRRSKARVARRWRSS